MITISNLQDKLFLWLITSCLIIRHSWMYMFWVPNSLHYHCSGSLTWQYWTVLQNADLIPIKPIMVKMQQIWCAGWGEQGWGRQWYKKWTSSNIFASLEGVNTVTQDLIKFSVINMMAVLSHIENRCVSWSCFLQFLFADFILTWKFTQLFEFTQSFLF
jgi:hypothetical protein